MTTAQQEAIDKAREILGEHFAAYVMVVQIDVGDKGESNPAFWDGGYATAYGLVCLAARDMVANRGEEKEV